jgi:hypothetical protein
MITTGVKTRVTGFHCRQRQKDCYKALKAFMALTGATTEEALQTLIQFAAFSWQSPQGRRNSRKWSKNGKDNGLKRRLPYTRLLLICVTI